MVVHSLFLQGFVVFVTALTNNKTLETLFLMNMKNKHQISDKINTYTNTQIPNNTF
jgi:hypothetical protein